MIVYFNNRFIPKEEVKISPDDRGFLFADGVYEVIRSYDGKLFRVEDHLNRLERSLRELRIKGPDTKNFKTIADKLIQDNHMGNGDAALYIQITRGAATPRKHVFPDKETPPTVYAYAYPFQSPHEEWKKGIKVILVPDIRWTRCDIKSVGLLPNAMACQQARENGAGEAVFVRDGVITEGSHTNFCAIFDKELVTYPKSNYILAGITRKVVSEICRELNIPVREFPIFEKDIEKADECMVLGTTTEVMPVVQVNDHIVGDGKPGPLTMKLQQAFRERVT
ncbi:D-amino-acid transaminase [Desulfonema magnum]|uniref:D-alanine aminotransferase n=1 Tax=Desulfonema magnum TaxID=45655 RepID=A0A975BN95_9BACT|nr:D-amino-acid transaminase [Desulfonema magnum]QTA88651.1 D-alanine aminotransferase [Desulfonema magnum]